ncbi:capsule polysaccharide export protein KpsE/RkpR [Litoreibacter meonggei]|uniref:Capsule polysaccharide export protein KpsE/RkpR n=1 Tax=Litoreibacter meonggei TaxID=1049199 RepID=A0A497X1K3_9RHOB|nr:hypothetical protein [Litoreibacter meonggei]RLJ59545.1 capsule polysaccharide export protein KpsE/RkpR [Litoreibacter meonggei]
MSNSKPIGETEDERIKAWRAERARIAEADKAQRIAQKQTEQVQSTQAIKQDQRTEALALLSSVQPDTIYGPAATSNTAHKPGLFAGLGNRALFLAMVVAPVLLVAFYLIAVATPLYEARSVIAITKPAESGNASRSGLLGGVQGPSNLSEVFRAHSYVQSQALMDALESELGLITEFSGPAIDPLKRLRTIPALSMSKSAQFGRYVESSVDIQSGLLTLYVRAPSDAQAISVSQAVLQNTEEQVNSLGQQVFNQRQAHATSVREAAEQQVAEAQAALVALQIKYQEVDPRNRVESIYTTIRDLEAEALKLNNEVQKAEIAGIGDSQQTQQTVALEARIRQQIIDERARLVAPDDAPTGSLNTLLMEYELATLELGLARDAVQTALKSQAEAGREAALNRSLFQVVVPPRTAQTAVYPRIPGTLALVLIICLALFSAVTMFRAART